MNVVKRGVWAVVVAAGKGERLGLAYNKVFYRLAGRSVLSRCLDALEAADCFEGAVLVLSEADRERYAELVRREGESPLVRYIASGGNSRQQSVKNGLDLLPGDARIVAIHDAARAFVPPEVVRGTVESAARHGSGVAASELTDTVKLVDQDGLSVQTPQRDSLRAVQTPQCFRVGVIMEAHRCAQRDGYEATDDAALVERYIGPVQLCCSELGRRNVKLTTREDMEMMEARLCGSMRVGHGYDAHRLAEGRRLVLCGVEVQHEKGLLGHSDADVAAHALMDALLGACGMGDIGRHFPDSDARYKGISSMLLLGETRAIIEREGFGPLNLDVTIVCEEPRLSPYMERMRARVAEALGMTLDMVNVKATTTEGLGFAGRGEGIEAHAVATVTKSH